MDRRQGCALCRQPITARIKTASITWFAAARQDSVNGRDLNSLAGLCSGSSAMQWGGAQLVIGGAAPLDELRGMRGAS